MFLQSTSCENDCHGDPLDFIRDRYHRFSDDLRGNRNELIHLNLFRISCENWARSKKQLISSVKNSNLDSHKMTTIFQHIELIYTMLYKVWSVIILTSK